MTRRVVRMMIPTEYLVRLVEEDAPFGDITSDAVVPDVSCAAVIQAEQEGVIAGLAEVSALCSRYGIAATPEKEDGSRVGSSEIVLSLFGSARSILLVERTILNILGRMSGIATQTRRLAEIAARTHPRCRVAATRKTCPGLRALDKKAVFLGGGDPHRMSLSDGILIKDNHLVLVPLTDAIRAAKAASAYRKIEVEVETPDDALTAAQEGADILLLDNMTPDRVRETLKTLKHAGLREQVVIEVSGGICEETLAGYAAAGVDLISMGSLTHSVKNFSFTLEILPERSE